MKTLVPFIYSFLILNTLLVSQEMTSAKANALIEERASIYLEESIEFKEMVGISGAIWKDDKIIWSDGSGYANLKDSQEAKPEMVHRIASISKPMTAIAILQLMEQGKLGLDEPITKYLPDFPMKEGVILIRHLLNHSSGIKAYKTNAEAFNTKHYNRLSEAVDLFKNRSLANKPGMDYQYTTYGYVVLGALIEAVSGTSYRAYMKKNIWDAAGMSNTDVEEFGKTYSNKSKLYVKEGKEFKEDINTDLSVKVPGGGIQSTVHDLIKFGKAVINHKLIDPNTFAMMINDSGIKKHGNPYGMGWFLYGKEGDPNGRIIGHSGSQSGTSTQFMIYLDHNMVIATLSNTNGAWNNVYALNGKLAQLIIDPETLKSPLLKAVPIAVDVLERHVGKYQAKEDKIMEVFRKGESLFAKTTGLESMEMFASTENNYFLRSMNVQFEFVLNKTDNSKSVTVIEDKDIFEYPRLNNKKSLARNLYHIMTEQDSETGMKWFEKMRNNDNYYLDKDQLNDVGYSLINIGEIKPAFAVFELNLKSFPNIQDVINNEVMISVGSQLLAAGYDKLAGSYFGLAIKVEPNSWEVHQSIGKAYLDNKNKKVALKYYKKSVKLNPNNEEAKAQIAAMQ